MSSHLIRHGLLLAVVLSAAALSGACASAPKAPVKVIGVANAHDRDDAGRMLLFFLEVRNPTSRQITLSQLDYQLEAKPWFVSEGRVRVSRSITAGGSAVIEVPVRLDRGNEDEERKVGVNYTFRGVLRVHSGAVDRDWPVRLNGELATTDTGSARSAFVVGPAVSVRE